MANETNQPAWMTGLDMTASISLAKNLAMSQADLEARRARDDAQSAADHARKQAARAARKANAYSADLLATIRAAFATEIA